ncbi:Crp/Fnr family transcriptional regulator [Rhodoblastus sp.]|uniref:Crp/Fnr family transcriptional regulator n=1 Tax=Rhodoblastus sp. TaxID=1962975 RepID=UPI003F983EFF
METAFSPVHAPSIFHTPPAHVVERARRRKDEAFANEPRALEPGENLFAAGQPACGPYRLLEGLVMVFRALPGPRRQILDIAGPGRTVGFSAGGRHDCDAVAISPAILVPLGETGKDESAAMLAEIARLRDLATLLGRKTAIERLATFLLQMMGEDFETGRRLPMRVSRQEIADYLGLVIETVSRNFVALKNLGALRRIGREDVVILDIPMLRRIAEGSEWPGAVAN